MKTLTFENDLLQLGIGEDATFQIFADRKGGRNYAAASLARAFASVRQGDKVFPADSARQTKAGLDLTFGASGVKASVRVRSERRYLVFEVVEVSGGAVDELVFIDAPLTLHGSFEEPFAACVLAMNLATRSPGLPGLSRSLKAACHKKFGLSGAKAAVMGCAPAEMRAIIREAVSAAEDLPKSAMGGPWAEDAPLNRQSYLFDFGSVTERNVDDWIGLMRSIGFTQLDFHGGKSFRFGDLAPNPELFPDGLDSFKAVIDRLHEAGMTAGLHTYAFFLDKRSEWVTPKPHPELGKDAVFTLAVALAPDSDTAPVQESTENMSTVTGFFVRNSVTLRIGDELIVYGGARKAPPYGFTQCTRGAHGTTACAHAAGARVEHLKECFGLFTPEGDSKLLEEVAARTAEVFNYCGFDMIYLDALDGQDILGGEEHGWHYGSKFVFEINKRLRKPALMEMSTFHHHLWHVRSRMGAWDHPTRAHKQFIDNHVAANAASGRIFLPSVLGWWALLFWSGPNAEPTFADDIEYLCAKALGTDSALALQGIDPASYAAKPGVKRLGDIVERYERLRLSGRVPGRVKTVLREPGKDYTLVETGAGGWGFRPVLYTKHKITDADGADRHWTVENPHGSQPLRVRIEALLSARPYAEAQLALTEFEGMDSLAAPGVSVAASLRPASCSDRTMVLSYRARNENAAADGAWTRLRRTFNPPFNMMQSSAKVAAQGQAQLEGVRQTVGMGLWVFGDGAGQTLNIRLCSPKAVTGAIADHYVVVDFKEWRYFELIEPEAERVRDYNWPPETEKESWMVDDQDHAFQGRYETYRQSVDFTRIESVGVWYHHVPAGGEVGCMLKPIRVLPLVSVELCNPTLRVGDGEIVFPVKLESGQYLEFDGGGPAVVYGRDGAPVARTDPTGPVPVLGAGRNEIGFACDAMESVTPRARVTVVSMGENIGF